MVARLMSLRACAYRLASSSHRWLYRTSANRAVLNADIARWAEVCGTVSRSHDPQAALTELVVRYPAFRSLFAHRMRTSTDPLGRLINRLSTQMLKPQTTLYL